jgi:hypothetical protein
MHQYLFEVERKDHSFAFANGSGTDSDAARQDVIRRTKGLRATLIGCSALAPEFGNICKRQLLE